MNIFHIDNFVRFCDHYKSKYLIECFCNLKMNVFYYNELNYNLHIIYAILYYYNRLSNTLYLYLGS